MIESRAGLAELTLTCRCGRGRHGRGPRRLREADTGSQSTHCRPGSWESSQCRALHQDMIRDLTNLNVHLPHPLQQPKRLSCTATRSVDFSVVTVHSRHQLLHMM